MSNKLNILVTGSSGFIGGNLVAALSSNKDINILRFVRGDNLDELQGLIIQSDFIYHCAGEVRPDSSNSDLESSNVSLTQSMCQFLEDNNKKISVLLPSSVHAVSPKNEYGRTKRESEIIVEGYSKRNHVPCYIYRLPHIFGEGCKPNYNSGVTTWIYNSINNLDIYIVDRDIKMRYVYVQDLVQDFIHKLDIQKPDLYLEVNTYYDVTLGEVADYVHEFKEYIDNKNFIVIGGVFKKKLFSVYKWYVNQL